MAAGAAAIAGFTLARFSPCTNVTRTNNVTAIAGFDCWYHDFLF
jgi:hypothetical protein